MVESLAGARSGRSWDRRGDELLRVELLGYHYNPKFAPLDGPRTRANRPPRPKLLDSRRNSENSRAALPPPGGRPPPAQPPPYPPLPTGGIVVEVHACERSPTLANEPRVPVQDEGSRADNHP